MSTYSIKSLEDEYIETAEVFNKLTVELNKLKLLIAEVSYTEKQSKSLLNVANRKIEAINILDEEMFALEQLLEFERIGEMSLVMH